MQKTQISKEILKKYFGYDKFRPLQEEIIQSIANKKDCLVLMPTGGGKSITFQIPALMSEGITIVVSPLISLMRDQVENLKSAGITAAYANSSQTASEQQDTERDVLNGKIKLLYVSPERLLTEQFYHFLQQIKVNLFAIDEAHCISQWGHDFRPEYTKLKFLKHYYPKVPIIALTATADKITARDIIKQLRLEEPKQFVASFDRPNLSLNVMPGRNRIQKILAFINNRPNQSGIVYCLSRKSTESVCAKLKETGVNAAYYHAGIAREERSKVQDDFINDNTTVICATIAFGMGIDKSNIRFVLHYNMPQNIENYYQQIGRGGRDGLKTDTLMFYSYADVMMYHKFIGDDHKNREVELAKLNRMQEFAEALTCRRKILLSYFGEHLPDDCGNCDVCNNPPEHFNGTTLTQKALSAIYRLNESVGINMLIDVLRGSSRKEILENGYDKIKTYGKGANLRFEDWQDVILQLLNQGLVEIAYDQQNVLQLTEASKDVLFKGREIKLVKPSEMQQKQQEKFTPTKTISKTQQIQNDLFERLRKLRKEIATQENVPPYVVFNDTTLKEMCKKNPSTLDMLDDITGIGEHKKNKYGQIFIDEIIKFIIQDEQDVKKIKGGTYVVTYELYKNGLSVDEIAKKRELKASTIFSHLAKEFYKGKDIDILKLIPETELNKIINAIKEIGLEDGLKPVYFHLEEKIDYGKIRLGISYLEKNK